MEVFCDLFHLILLMLRYKWELLCSNSHFCFAPEISTDLWVGSRAREMVWRSGYFPCYVLSLPQDDNVSEL